MRSKLENIRKLSNINEIQTFYVKGHSPELDRSLSGALIEYIKDAQNHTLNSNMFDGFRHACLLFMSERDFNSFLEDASYASKEIKF